MNHLQRGVTAFHTAMGHPVATFPIVQITPTIAQLLKDRAAWLHEEADELLEAVEEGNIVKALDALGDSAYFAVGGYVVLGHDMDVFWDNIQGANMAKLDENGKPVPHPTIPNKIGKPEGWEPPEAAHLRDLEAAYKNAQIEGLARQFAYARAVDPDREIQVLSPITPIDLARVMKRAESIYERGADHAKDLYAEMLAFLVYSGQKEESDDLEALLAEEEDRQIIEDDPGFGDADELVRERKARRDDPDARWTAAGPTPDYLEKEAERDGRE